MTPANQQTWFFWQRRHFSGVALIPGIPSFYELVRTTGDIIRPLPGVADAEEHGCDYECNTPPTQQHDHKCSLPLRWQSLSQNYTPQNYQSNYAAVGSGVTTHDDVANAAAGALVLIVALNALKADRSKG